MGPVTQFAACMPSTLESCLHSHTPGVAHACNPSTPKSLRQEDGTFVANLSYTVRSYLYRAFGCEPSL